MNLNYKGFKGIVKWDKEANHYHGDVVLDKGVITFKANNIDCLIIELRASIDDYLEFRKGM